MKIENNWSEIKVAKKDASKPVARNSIYLIILSNTWKSAAFRYI